MLPPSTFKEELAPPSSSKEAACCLRPPCGKEPAYTGQRSRLTPRKPAYTEEPAYTESRQESDDDEEQSSRCRPPSFAGRASIRELQLEEEE